MKNNKNTNELILMHTKTIILLLCVITICSLVSLVLSIMSFKTTKTNDATTEETVEEEAADYDVSMFKKIDVDKFVKLFNNKEEKSIIYLGRETCGYCVKFLPNLQKAQKEYNYQTYYLDITTVDDKGVDKITKLNKFLKENYGYTPMVIVVQDGKILNKKVGEYEGVGYTEYETFAEFLEELDYKK